MINEWLKIWCYNLKTFFNQGYLLIVSLCTVASSKEQSSMRFHWFLNSLLQIFYSFYETFSLECIHYRVPWFHMQIASFIKTHIFSRRRPIDGWKYMIEEFGPNAKKGKGSVSRLPNLSDSSTQPFKEEKVVASPSLKPLRRS